MSKRLSILSAVVVAALAGASLLYVIIPAFAQQPPTPPKEDPPPAATSCCRVLSTSSRTVGGPGAVALSTESLDFIFESERKISICATAENAGATPIQLTLCRDLSRGTTISCGVAESTWINPGHSASLCADTVAATIRGPGGSYRWRVDRSD